ncbi:hypothetical protein [Mesorhizobium sp. M7A.F.Ca.MR.148.00.0.0]|uniref:hypothetical protein n=1 Tax=Mesorhizobium sp. M7A.F.Ca.MR.148.00.0.0 TaxID=2496775 RepID=UPI000FCBEBBD|nr:hypothetical protein [Mesorhizobium sp. M7A.F.Ca.MR.148.00.0.0]RUV33387.1 hypothetical protein EOB49_30690 [Mesorhizobium sp. M7A.F.Ca.MR.148.00.0.0]
MMPNKHKKAERLPWSVEQALLQHRNIYMAAREAVIAIWVEMPNKTWDRMRPVLEQWIAAGNIDRSEMRRIIDEVDYLRREFPRALTLSNDNRGLRHDGH